MTTKQQIALILFCLLCLTGCQTAQQQETTTTTTATTSTTALSSTTTTGMSTTTSSSTTTTGTGAATSTTTTSTGTTTSTMAGTNIVLKGSINKRQSGLGYADFYGEVQNIGSTTVDYVEVHITMKNASGGVIATDYSFIDGTVLKTSSNTNTCLRPGDIGAFCVSSTTNYSDVSSYTHLIDWETFSTSTPNASFEIVGSITEGSDYLGNREYLGEIRNNSATNATFVEILFVSKDSAGKVIDISSSFVTGTDVPAGVTRSFDVTTSANSTEVASYYYLFDWNE